MEECPEHPFWATFSYPDRLTLWHDNTSQEIGHHIKTLIEQFGKGPMGPAGPPGISAPQYVYVHCKTVEDLLNLREFTIINIASPTKFILKSVEDQEIYYYVTSSHPAIYDYLRILKI